MSQFAPTAAALTVRTAQTRGRAASARTSAARPWASSTAPRKTVLHSVRWLSTSSGGTAAKAL